MIGIIHEWETFGHRYRLCKATVDPNGWRVTSPAEAARVVRLLVRDPGAVAWLRRGVAQLGEMHRSDLIGELERSLGRGTLLLFEQPVPPTPLPRLRARPEEGPGGAQPALARQTATWIEISVVEDTAPERPLANATYRLWLPDGSVREGTLDVAGRFHVDGIDPGRCFFELLESQET